MDKYKEIRPYNDDEVRPVLNNLLGNSECLQAVTRLRFPRGAVKAPWLFNTLVRVALRRQLKNVDSVYDYQMIVEHYLSHMIKTATSKFTLSGTEHLSPDKAYLFMSNHRDIALDPALINYALHHAGFGTVRIAIGDNLLKKDFVADLIRLNKSFIVKRSAKGPRQLFAALKLLSGYIRDSITLDNHNVWIAEREGRAKNGDDRADPTIIKMFAMSADKEKSFAEGVNELHIVPVSVSYEYDPCDVAKAKELCHLEKHGSYEKQDQEDVASIALGISGFKGHVHLEFGKELNGDFQVADDVSKALDNHIIANYVLHPSNYFAYYALHGEIPKGSYSDKALPFDVKAVEKQQAEFDARVAACPEEYRRYLLMAYAKPIENKIAMGSM